MKVHTKDDSKLDFPQTSVSIAGVFRTMLYICIVEDIRYAYNMMGSKYHLSVSMWHTYI